MILSRVRGIVQQAAFLVLTYGGRIGINLGYALPCFSCPFVPGCGGYCFLMALQGVGPWGIGYYVPRVFSEVLWWLFIFALLAILLSKLWCGWLCPFGTLQDWLSCLRKTLGIREAEFSWRTRKRLRPVKYVLLAVIVLVPFLLAFAALPADFNLFFCQICPARVVMPLFAGKVYNFALDFTNPIVLAFSFLSLSIAAVVIVGCFFKERFFCIFCPMLPLLQLFQRISLIRFEKAGQYCSGCGNCERMCPMDIREVHLETKHQTQLTEDCLFCMRCVESCPEDRVLSFWFLKWPIFSSARAYVAKLLQKGNISHGS